MEKDLLYFDKLWRDSDPKNGMQHTQETWDKIAEEWSKTPKEEQDKKNKMCADLAHYLAEKGVINAESSVVDIGCGFGGNAMEFASIVKQVTCSDISPRMLDFCRDAAAERGLTNLDYLACDFHAFDIEAGGWSKKYDLVFTSLSPALNGLGSVKKVNRVSRRWCFNNSFIYRKDSLRNAVLQNVFGKPATNIWTGDSTYCLFNILWQMDCSPEVTYYNETISSQCRLGMDLVRHIVKTIIRDREPSAADFQKVYDFLAESMAVDGIVTKTVESRFAWTLWNVEKWSDD